MVLGFESISKASYSSIADFQKGVSIYQYFGPKEIFFWNVLFDLATLRFQVKLANPLVKVFIGSSKMINFQGD